MIYLTQTYIENSAVIINVQGNLDNETLPALQDVYRENLESGRTIKMNFEKTSTINRRGRAFLREIQGESQFIGLPAYVKMIIG